MGRPASDKRERLVFSAIDQFHRNGYARTSLVDVAKAADLSAGNVFYYFKAKDDLARAVIDEWCSRLARSLAVLEDRTDDPWRRLQAFVEQAHTLSEVYVALGCPLAGLTRDLRQESDALKTDVAKVYSVQFHWLAHQLRLAGLSMAVAKENSRSLMAGYHGSILLAYAQNDPSLIEGEVKRLKKWLREIRVLLERGS
jgi:TetR/AcrR family transcriptional regulator, transcriptional repressor for nem operon